METDGLTYKKDSNQIQGIFIENPGNLFSKTTPWGKVTDHAVSQPAFCLASYIG